MVTEPVTDATRKAVHKHVDGNVVIAYTRRFGVDADEAIDATSSVCSVLAGAGVTNVVGAFVILCYLYFVVRSLEKFAQRKQNFADEL